MAETGQLIFTHKEVVEILLKQQGIHEGTWQLLVKFGLGAANIGQTETEVTPAAVVSVVQLGLQKTDKESNIAVDAGRVNPRTTKAGKKKKK